MSDPMTEQALAAERARPTRTPEEIEADIERTRESLADDIDVLQDRLSPANLMAAAKERVLGFFRHPDGSLDPVRTAAAVGVAVVLVAYVVRRRNV